MGKKIKLNLGCGTKPIEGFTNVDARKLPSVDVVDNVIELNKFKPNSVDLIYASHLLEHIDRRSYTKTLSRWYEVLKPNGILRIAVPDIEAAINHYNIHKNLRVLRGIIWGGQTYSLNFHNCGWTFLDLKDDLFAVGFLDIKRYDWKKTEHAHVIDFSASYLPHDEEAIKTGNFTDKHMHMSLNVEARK